MRGIYFHNRNIFSVYSEDHFTFVPIDIDRDSSTRSEALFANAEKYVSYVRKNDHQSVSSLPEDKKRETRVFHKILRAASVLSVEYPLFLSRSARIYSW